jgi:hypothetical protein
MAVYTTLYPAAERFLDEWHRSIQVQSDPDFDLWFGLDGVPPERVTARLGPARVAWTEAVAGETPAALRSRVMAQICDAYDAVVFVDSDDILAASRVAAARQALGSADVAACALQLMDASGCDLGLRFEPPVGESAEGILPLWNVFGLSNTAYRTSVLRDCLPVPGEAVLIDWLLATRAWLAGAVFSFDRTPRMRYRRHEDNVGALVRPFSAPEVLAATELVRQHYGLIGATTDKGQGPHWEALRRARGRVERFHHIVSRSERSLQRYVEELNRLPQAYVWWWCVANPLVEVAWSD